MDWSSLKHETDARRKLLTRRGFLKVSAAGLASAACLGGYAVGVEPHWVQTVFLDMPLVNLPPQWEGRRVVQISDLHVGRQVSNSYLVDCFRRVERLDPHILLITGDFQTARSDERVDDVWRVMRNLRPPAGGCYAVLGNHDYGAGWKDPRVGAMIADRLADCRIDVLRNSRRSIGGLNLVGVEDLWSETYDPRRALSGLSADTAMIAMCHNPDGVDGIEWQTFRGWVLSGHTHGGQCRPPFLPAPIVPVMNQRYQAGEYDVGAGRTLYINRGLGHSWQLRFCARPEITCFTLRRNTAS